MTMEKIRIGDICIFENGDRGENYPSKKDFVGRGIPFINSGNISNGKIEDADLNYITEEKYNKLRAGKTSKGDFVFTLRGSLGKNAIIEFDKCAIASMLVIMRPDETKIDKTFFRYAMNSPWLEKQVANVDNGSIQGNLGVSNVKDFFIPFPNIIEQKKIASILATLDNKISTNNKIIETSEKLMREIYNYWFVQFDFPDENGRPYKSSGGEMVYDEKLKREIPKRWRVQNLLKNDLCKDIKPGIDKFDGVKTYYATADVINGEMGVGAQIDYDNRESRANMQPKPNSVWFAKMKNSIKHITVVPTSDDLIESSVFSTGFFGLKCEPETLPYIRSFIYSDYFEKVKDLNSNGATMEAINNDGVRNVKLLIPDGIILKKYSEAVGACLSQNDTLRKENAKLISLRDWLLPMLMNGQIVISQ